MAELSKQALKVENNTSFPNNNNGAITPSDLRAFNVDMIDSTVNQTDFTNFSGSVAGEIDGLEAFSSSLSTAFVSTASFNSYTQSNDQKWTNIGAQSGSWITESESGSFLITASFDNGTRNLTFTKGDASTFAVNIPDVSGSTLNTGSFATTGSNNFIGNQNVDGRVIISGSSVLTNNNYLLFTRPGAGDIFRIGMSDNGQTYDFTVTGSTNQQLWLIDNQGGTYINNFTAPIIATNNVRLDGGFTASLQDGYAWVGNASGKNSQVPTSSFGGGGSINTGSFATTGSNTFTGNQIIDGGNTLYMLYGGINMASNIEGSGSQYSGVNIFADTAGYPSDIYESFQILDASNANNGILQLAANSYTPQYGGEIVAWIGAGGNNAAGNNTAIIFRTGSALMEVFKPTSFAYNVNITGSLTASLQQGYVWVGNASGITTTVSTSSFGTSINTGSFATTGSNTFIGNQTIIGSVSISSSAATDLAITGAAKVVSQNGLQVNTIAPNTFNIGTTQDPTVNAEAYMFGSTASVSSIYVGVFDDPNFNTDVELKLSADSNGLSFNDWDNGSTFSYVPFITLEPNLGNNPAPVFTRGLVVTGSANVQNLNVSGSVVISGSTSLRGNLIQSTGSITAFGNVRTTNGLFSSSINGGLEIAGLGYVGSGSAGAYFIGTTTQDLKIQNWYSSSVDGKNIVIENYSPTGSTSIYGKVALRARGVGGAVTVENTTNFRVECPTQITGSLTIQSGSGDLFVHGHKQFNVGAFQSNVTQSGSANVSQSVNFDTTDVSYGVTLSNSSRLNVANAGVYLITFSVQVLADSGADTFYIWLKKNGTNTAESATKISLSNNSAQVATVTFVNEAAANDYYELCWQSTQGDAVLYTEAASGNIPAIPSVIVTITQAR